MSGSSPVPPRKWPKKQEQEPAGEEITEVAPGVLRLQLPISMPGLGHVNMYALLDDRGAAIVDPGMPGPLSYKAMRRKLKMAGLRPGDIHSILITHSHPDHFGGAAQLASEADAAVVAHVEFRTWGQPKHTHADATDDTADHADEEVHEVPAPAGTPWGAPPPWAPGGSVGYTKERGTMMRQMPLTRRIQYKVMGSKMAGNTMRRFMTFPAISHRVADGDMIRLAGRDWQAVHTPGHTPDHLCLYDATEGVVLSGDHVLPTITPHISGLGPDPDSLGSFYASLDRMAALEGVRTVLPAHGQPFADLAGRAADIKAHHDERLQKLRIVAADLGPSSVEEFSHQLFRRERWGSMAESETYAHLEHLRLTGLAERREANGGFIYELEPL